MDLDIVETEGRTVGELGGGSVGVDALPRLGVVGAAAGAEATAISPCSLACPLGINVQRYVGQAQRGQVLEALETILERCPLPGVCGYLCQRPCEAACRRGGVDRAVAIRWIKRVAVGAALAAGRRGGAAARGPATWRVGVVGAGPAGLAAAWHLARRGHGVTLFERRREAGGLLDEVVPDFRLPRRVLRADVDRILAHPLIELRAGVEVDLRELLERGRSRDGLAAILVATGAGFEERPRLDGVGLGSAGPGSGVVTPLEVLRALGEGALEAGGGAAVVMGSSTAAVAAARTLRRRGWREVTLVAGRGIERWPADRQDLDAALADGVRLCDAFLVERVETEDGRLAAVLGRRAEPDRLGRPTPAGDRERLAADMLVAEAPRRGWPERAAEGAWAALPRTAGGWVAVDPGTLEAGRPGVFAAGECATGPKTVVEALAAGGRAAAAIDRHVRGLPPAPLPPRRRPWLELAVLGGVEADGTPSPARPGQAIEVPPSEAAAEARRCLRCGPCAECDRCDPSCRHERAVVVEAGGRRLVVRAPAGGAEGALAGAAPLAARVDETLCTGCGRCEAVCPHQAVVVRLCAGAGATPRAAVSRPACRGCGRCMPACPFGALDFARGHGDGRALRLAVAGEVRP